MDQESQGRASDARHRRRGDADRSPSRARTSVDGGAAWLSKAKGIGWLAENPRYTRLAGACRGKQTEVGCVAGRSG